MAEKKEEVNTSKSVREAEPVTAASLDKEIKDAKKALDNEKLEAVTIPAYLKKRLGANVPVGVNGVVVHVPVGKKAEIPKSMAEVLKQSLNDLKL